MLHAVSVLVRQPIQQHGCSLTRKRARSALPVCVIELVFICIHAVFQLEIKACLQHRLHCPSVVSRFSLSATDLNATDRVVV